MHIHICPNCIMAFVVALQSLPSWIVVNLSWPLYRKARPYGLPHPARHRIPGLLDWHQGSTSMTRQFNWGMWFSVTALLFATWRLS